MPAPALPTAFPPRAWAVVLASLAWAASAQQGDRRGETQAPLPNHWTVPPSPALSPKEELATFHVAPGFAIELAACEPAVQDPVALAFDEDGRMWVAEMRGFMPDLDDTGSRQPNGRVSVLEDTDGDGYFETARVYLDGLVLPRAIAVVHQGILVVHDGKLWLTRDLDGDLRADETEVIDERYVTGGNVEHQPNGLLQGIDHWLYNAKSKSRHRFLDGRWIREETEFRGQWGITRDDFGRLFYNYNYSQLHGDVVPPNQIGRNPHHPSAAGLNLLVATNQAVFPIRMNTGVNRGYRPGILDHQGRLKEFASACAPLIYRGDQFPAEYHGNAFVCGPGANVVKRNVLETRGLAISSRFAYPDSEFLASTDERFRPVSLANAPDGALLVVDMYRGILQHKQYMTTHLRNEILARDLDQPIHMGRVWRVRYTDSAPSQPPPKLGKLPAPDLIPFLAHTNGFWRDTAQRLLVDRGDRAVQPDLERVVRQHDNALARLHALWTLDGLGALSSETLARALDDPHPQARIAGLRILATQWDRSPPSASPVLDKVTNLAGHSDLEIVCHAVFALTRVPGSEPLPVFAGILDRHGHQQVLRDAVFSGLRHRELEMLRLALDARAWAGPGGARDLILAELASAIYKEGNPGRVGRLLEWAGAESFPAWKRQALLAGLLENARGHAPSPVPLAARPAIHETIPETATTGGSNARVLFESLFSWPGHTPPERPPPRRATLSAEQRRLFGEGRELYLTVCSGCHGQAGEGLSPLAPPLAGSQWTVGSEQHLIRIILNGLEGPIHVNGTRYEPPLTLPNMPSVASLEDDQIAAILTFIRRAWEQQADPVAAETVAAIREQVAGRQEPWTENELLELDEEGRITP